MIDMNIKFQIFQSNKSSKISLYTYNKLLSLYLKSELVEAEIVPTWFA